MTIRAKNRAILAGIIIGVAAVIGTLLPTIASGDLNEVREVRIVVRDMTYYEDGRAEPNPTLTFRAGERVRLVLKNEDAGMDHDFVLPQWDVRTKVLEGRGEDAIIFNVPSARGTETYHCTPHPRTMRGTVTVE